MCLDGTHGTNRHGYHLFTIASKDKFGRVIALAFLVTRFNTQDIICDFLKAAILAHGITPQTIVTDDGTTEGPAATTVFPAPKTRHLLCYVHILRAWSVSDGLCRTVDTTGSPQLTASLALTCLAWSAPPPAHIQGEEPGEKVQQQGNREQTPGMPQSPWRDSLPGRVQTWLGEHDQGVRQRGDRRARVPE